MWNYMLILLLSFSLNTSNRILLASDLDESVGDSAENEIYYEISLASKNLSDIHLEASKLISKYIDEDVQPCDDFYKFACGNFANISQKIRPGIDHFKVKQKAIDAQLGKLLKLSLDEVKLKHEFDTQDSINAFIVAKSFYSSCKDKKSSETAGIQPLLKLIEKYGGWPLIKGDQWDENNWDLIGTIAEMTRDGLNTNAFFNLHTTDHELEPKRYTLTITEPRIEVRHSLFTDHRPYFNFMVNTAVQFGADESSARIQMAQVLHFERELAENTISTSYMLGFDDDLKYMITIKELQGSYPYIDWLKYIQSVLPSDVKVDQDEPLYFDFSDYFVRLENLLKQTRKRTIANYLIWRAVFFSTEYLNENLYSERMKMSDQVRPSSINVHSRYHNCLDKTTEKMQVAINIIFNQLRKPKITPATDALVDNVRSEFIKMIQEVRWMKTETKKEAIKKAENMTIVVALNSTNYKNEIQNYYDGLNLQSENYFENVLSVLRFEEVKKHQKLNQSVNEADLLMYMSAKVVNAFYAPWENTVNLNTAILDFFVADLPNYLNYGSFGLVAAHEIAHAFDAHSHADRIRWSHDKNEFDRRAECFVEQYTRLGINGDFTLNENMADNAGVKAAYRAYQKYVIRHGDEALLPNLKYTPNQLFWIALAQPFCLKDTKDTTEAMDSHSPSAPRVNGIAQNMYEFTVDFQCSSRSEMNPKDRCEIW